MIKWSTAIEKLNFFVRKRLPINSFARNVSITFFGNVSIFFIQVLLSPIITRLYLPEEYGLYSIFGALVINISTFASLKFTQAIVLPRETWERRNLAIAAITSSVTIVLVITICLVLFKPSILNFFRIDSLGNIIYLLPVTVLLTVAIEIFVGFNVFNKKFSANVVAGISNNLISRIWNVFFALYLSAKSLGLILGDIVGKGICFIMLLLSTRFWNKRLNFYKPAKNQSIKSTILKYKSFPLYYLPANILIILSSQLPLYTLQLKYTSATVGIFALASSMLDVFNRMVPNALSPVFLQRAAELHNNSLEMLAERTYKLFFILLLVSVGLFSNLVLWGDLVFDFAFGSTWKMSGIFAAMIAMQYAYGFIAIPLSEIYNITSRQKFLFTSSIVNLVLRIGACAVVIFGSIKQVDAILIFGLTGGVGNILLILGVFYVLRYNQRKVIGYLILSMLILGLIIILKWIGQHGG